MLYCIFPGTNAVFPYIINNFARQVKFLQLKDNSKRMEFQKINRLKVVLVENGKTGKWLAEQVGKNEATVSRWCSNKMQPSLDMLVRIAELLNVDPRQLINSGNNEQLWKEDYK